MWLTEEMGLHRGQNGIQGVCQELLYENLMSPSPPVPFVEESQVQYKSGKIDGKNPVKRGEVGGSLFSI